VSCQTSDLAVALCTCIQYPCTALQTATSLVFTNVYTNCNVRLWQALPCLNVKTTKRVVISLNVRALTVVSQSRVRSSLG
jgi:hypothetical protein